MLERPLRVLMISAEVETFARTGGLGDVVLALSCALGDHGLEVLVVTPRYGVTKVPASAKWWWSPVHARVGWGASDVRELGVLEAQLPGSMGTSTAGGVRVCLLANDELFSRAGIYGDAHGSFGDNATRFATLSRAALSVAERVWGRVDDGGGPDIIHAHDWHAALAVVYAKLVMGDAWRARPSVFTIHNLAYQGVMGTSELDALGIPREAYARGWLAHQGNVNLMKGAIELADRVTTVSETYANEIRGPQEGYGLDAHLRWHSSKLTGIVNGIDTRSFDPASDAALVRRYDARDVRDGKRVCKRALLAESGLDGDLDAPLFASVSRLTSQKGIDLLAAIVPALVDRGARFLFVGQGDDDLERALRETERRFRGRVATKIAFDPQLARRIFAGTDFLVVPSRYEPCGLTQLYAMRYGAIPVVTPVGGLRDTVTSLDAARSTGTGIVAQSASVHALLVACEDALGAYRDRVAWPSLIGRAMARDSSWETSAEKYIALYRGLGAHPRRDSAG